MSDFGPWQELKSSKGKMYFYNRVTQVSQWTKPTEWIESEKCSQIQVVNGNSRSPSVISSKPSTSNQNNTSRSNHSHHSSHHESRTDRSDRESSRNDRIERESSKNDRIDRESSRIDRIERESSRNDRFDREAAKAEKFERESSRTDKAERDSSRTDRESLRNDKNDRQSSRIDRESSRNEKFDKEARESSRNDKFDKEASRTERESPRNDKVDKEASRTDRESSRSEKFDRDSTRTERESSRIDKESSRTERESSRIDKIDREFSRSEREPSSTRNHNHDHHFPSTSYSTGSNRHYQSASSQNNSEPVKPPSTSSNGHNHNHSSYAHKPNKRPSSRTEMSTSSKIEPHLKSESTNHRKSRDKALQAVSDEEDLGPPSKKIKSLSSRKRHTNESEPLDGAEMISDDEAPSSSRNVSGVNINGHSTPTVLVAEDLAPQIKEEKLKLISDAELDSFINNSFCAKVRIAEAEELDAEIRRQTIKEREIDRQTLDKMKEEITVKQLYTATRIEGISIQIKSKFPKTQADVLENSGF